MTFRYDHAMGYNKPRDDSFKETNGHYDAEQKKMTNLAEPTDLSDAATKQYVDGSFGDCLKLDKLKYDVGGRRLTGLTAAVANSDAASKEYVDSRTLDASDLAGFSTEGYVDEKNEEMKDEITVSLSNYATEDFVDGEVRDVKGEILKTLDDFATIKYVDGALANNQEQNEEGEKPEHVTKERVDKLEAELDGAKKSFSKKNFVNKPFLDAKLAAYNPKYFFSIGDHDNEASVKFSIYCRHTGGFSFLEDGRVLRFPEKGIWEITLIDMTKSPVDRTIEMKFTGLDMNLAGNEFNQVIKKSGSWTDLYLSRIVPLLDNATVRINFSPAEAVSGLDGKASCKIIVKKYL